MKKLLLALLAAAAGAAFGVERNAMQEEARAIERGHGYMVAALRGITGSGGSGTISAGTVGQCAVYTGTTTLGGVDCPTLSGTPAAGDISYWTSSSAQALLTAAAGSTGAYLRSAGTGAAPIWSTLVLPNAASAGQIAIAASSNTITMSSTPTLGASGTLGTITFGNATSGTILLTPAAGALGTVTLTMPATTGTILQSGTAVTVAQGGTGGTAIQAATQNLTVPRIIYKQGLPLVYMSSGTMTGSPNGTGAFTGLTALTGVQPGRALCYMPANSVATSSAAGWYFCTFSSTTAGNIIDTTPYTPSSTPPVWPTSPVTPSTASTWTGATGAITAYTFSVPANSMGANGFLDLGIFQTQHTNNANAKSITFAFGALSSAAHSLASIASSLATAKIANAGTANNILTSNIGSNPGVGTIVNGTVDTTSAVTMTVTINKGTATDNLGVMSIVGTILSDGT